MSTKTKEDRGTMHTVTDSHDPSTVGWRFFLWWMLAFVGFPLGGFLAFMVVGSVEGVASGALVFAAITGMAMLLILRGRAR